MEKRMKGIVEEDCAGWSVEQFLKKKMELTSHQIRSAKYRPNGISRNGIQVRTTARVSAGDLLEVLVEENGMDAGKVEAVPGPVNIVYEDEDLILLNKPAGIAVHPSHGHYRDTLANFLQHYLAEKGNFAPVRAVGRLDKETSGIVVFAKNQLTAARLGSRKDSIQKEYLALVHGHFQDKEGFIDAPIAKAPGELNKMEVAAHGKPARTHYQVQKESGDDTFLSLDLDTGRTHQIRVHMASIGHPLVGDQIYGTDADPFFSRAALHCFRVKITHPYTGEILKFEVPLPADMRRCYNQGKA